MLFFIKTAGCTRFDSTSGCFTHQSWRRR